MAKRKASPKRKAPAQLAAADPVDVDLAGSELDLENFPFAYRRGGGPAPIEFNLEHVRKLGALNCTYEELAGFFDVSLVTIKRRMDEDEAFRSAFEGGKAALKVSLRRAQMLAARSGNPALLIWLGKQYLGQAEKVDSTVSAPGGGPMRVEIAFVDSAAPPAAKE